MLCTVIICKYRKRKIQIRLQFSQTLLTVKSNLKYANIKNRIFSPTTFTDTLNSTIVNIDNTFMAGPRIYVLTDPIKYSMNLIKKRVHWIHLSVQASWTSNYLPLPFSVNF